MRYCPILFLVKNIKRTDSPKLLEIILDENKISKSMWMLLKG